MPFVGRKPTNAPLTSSDLGTGIVGSTNIADGTIANADIANSTINLTTKVTGTLPVANGGTNLSSGFFNGITEVDQWRLSTNFVIASGTSDINSGWERNDSTGYDKIGTGMTQSSGIFTFPSTGYYFIQFITSPIVAGENRYVGNYIKITTDNSNYSTATEIYTSGSQANADSCGVSTFIFDVTSTANCKVKFTGRSDDTSATYQASTTQNKTHVTFIRLGDT
jgi:hypothetical protein